MVFGCEHIICPQVDSPPGIRPHRYIIKGICIKRADQNGRINQAMIHPFINFIGSPGEIVEPDKGMLFLKCENERGKTLRHHQLSAAHHDTASQLFFAGRKFFFRLFHEFHHFLRPSPKKMTLLCQNEPAVSPFKKVNARLFFQFCDLP